jgi:hypothetical protein
MKTRFLAIHPLIGTKGKPAQLRFMQRSPYYWWWAYLRRNADYLETCKNGGAGKLSQLYEDFGDVRSEDFRSWWGGSKQRGVYLFGEQSTDFRIRPILGSSNLEFEWNDPSKFRILVINMSIGRRRLQKDFSTFLSKNHKSQQGRPALGTISSTARYPLHRNYSVENLKRMLAVYDAWIENEILPSSQRLKQWELGERIRLVPEAITKENDLDYRDKRNVMSVTFSKLLKKSKLIIANTAKGQFPKSDE